MADITSEQVAGLRRNLHARTLRIEQEVSWILPCRDRIVDRDSPIQRCRRIG
jgi:hypothetical protein